MFHHCWNFLCEEAMNAPGYSALLYIQLTYNVFSKPYTGWTNYRLLVSISVNFRKLNIVLRSSVSTKMVRCFHVTVTLKDLKVSRTHNEKLCWSRQLKWHTSFSSSAYVYNLGKIFFSDTCTSLVLKGLKFLICFLRSWLHWPACEE